MKGIAGVAGVRTAGAAAGLVLVLTACSGDNQSGARLPQTAAAGRTAARPTVSSPPPTRVSVTTCATSKLRLTDAGGFGAGGGYAWYYLTNVGANTCTMEGFPGVAVLDSRGHVAQHPAVHSSHPGTWSRLPTKLVVLRRGQRANFLVFSTDAVPNADCPHFYTGTTIQVYPPGNRIPLRRPFKGVFCDLVVGPVQAGTAPVR